MSLNILFKKDLLRKNKSKYRAWTFLLLTCPHVPAFERPGDGARRQQNALVSAGGGVSANGEGGRGGVRNRLERSKIKTKVPDSE